MADTIKEVLQELSNNASTDDLSHDWEADVDQAFAEIKHIILEAKPPEVSFIKSDMEFAGDERHWGKTEGYNSAIDEYHNNLLKALEG